MNLTNASLPPGHRIRPASAQDMWALRRLVLVAKLDPTQLRWQQFWVIENQGKILACGQLRNFVACQELGSLVVAAPWRQQGLGTVLAQYLIEQSTQPLYLECLGAKLAKFYQRLGFVSVEVHELPRALQRKFKFSRAIANRLRLPLYQMHWPPDRNS
ncbi:MAG: GNAT family N-acetyltransferase [Cyanobacteria bacterium J06639_14]